jgi:hypothetical protein
MKYGIVFWAIHVTVERYLHYKRQSLELRPVSNLVIHVEFCLRDWRS